MFLCEITLKEVRDLVGIELVSVCLTTRQD